MAKDATPHSQSSAGFSIQFTLLGLIAFSVALVLSTGVIAFAAVRSLHPEAPLPAKASANGRLTQDTPPWGDLMISDVDLELPEEYVALDLGTVIPPWVFPGMTTEEVGQLMRRCGLSAEQVTSALAPERVAVTSSNVVVQPEESLVVSLSAAARGAFYRELAKRDGNNSKTSPFCFPGSSLDDVLRSVWLAEAADALLKSLSYRYGNDAAYFSDFHILSRHLRSDQQRREVFQTLSRQRALFARLRVSPATDIDKVLGYWASVPGVRQIDLRPLLESLQRIPEGGSVSLMYFMPPFARENLYRFPVSSAKGYQGMNCHWTTMNFFNETTDDRFFDSSFCQDYLAANYYQVATTTRYGDLVFLMDENKNGIHSAVYIADDIVFTKNGDGYQQPWMLMRLKNLVAKYSVTGPVQVVAYRSRNL